ncbi:MAG TPA: Spy/CpxP family protein refolding chaperone [Pyrinomonadaceae bacterium]|jgi:Spy/CpxP family protein refolding chaperone
MKQIGLRKIGGVFALGCALLLAVAAVFAQQGGRGGDFGGPRGPRGERGFGGPGGRGEGLGAPFLRDLNLTDAQKAQIKQITDGLAESTKALREKLHAGHDGPPAFDGTFDEAAVRAAAQARANAQVELEVAHARAMSQIYNVLTAEQKAQVAQRRQEFEQKRREHEAQRGANPNN